MCKFVNFKATAYMRTSIATMEPIMIDSVITAAYYKDKVREEYYNGDNICPNEQTVVGEIGKLIDRKFDVFCASQGIGDNREFVSSWVKRFDDKDTGLIKFKGKGKKRLDVGGGPMKNYHMPIVLQSCQMVTFYIRGDMEEIRRLLTEQISYLGKKGSQGFGQIIRWKFEELDNDYSIWKDGELMRPIPVRYFSCKDYNIQYIPLTPPYWRREKELCTMPKTTIM